jgi:predicted nucleic acid-binding Zn ribbon protein
MSRGTGKYDHRGRSEGPLPLARALEDVAGRLGAGRPELLAVIFGRWEELVGPSLAAHVQPVKLTAGTLVVSVDHPAWATQVRHLSAEILERMRSQLAGADAPQRLEIRVRP